MYCITVYVWMDLLEGWICWREIRVVRMYRFHEFPSLDRVEERKRKRIEAEVIRGIQCVVSRY